jgi:integrase
VVSTNPKQAEILRRLQFSVLGQTPKAKEGTKMNTRGQGRVFERKGSSFLWIAYYAHGKEEREVARHVRTGEKIEISEKGRHEAERFLKRRLGELAAEQHGGRAFVGPQQERVTVNDLLDGLERDYRLRDKWNVKIESALKPVRAHFGTWRAVDVTTETVSKYIEDLREQGRSNSTINHRAQFLSQTFKVGMRNKQISSAPFIPRLSEVGNERQGFFETADFEAVVEKLPEHLRDLAHFGFLTGWRKGSIESLRWSDVGDGIIYLRAQNSKTRKPETVPLEGELQDIIDRRRAASIWEDKDGGKKFAEYVFHSKGEPIGDFRKSWWSACVAAGLGKMTCPKCGAEGAERSCETCKVVTRYSGPIFHDFRRTAARNMLAAGVPQAVAMKITGHRTDSMFRRYAIVDEAQKREALAKTQQYLATTPAERKIAVMGKAK